MSSVVERKPHAVLTPFPVQGHINPVLNLAKLLHLRGFHITFVHTEYNHKRLLKSRGPNALDGIPDFRFMTIPDGLPSNDGDDDNSSGHQDLFALWDSSRQNFLQPFRNLLAALNRSAAADGDVPPVSCLVCDGNMPFTIQAARELGLPIVLLWPASAASLLTIKINRTLLHKGLLPLKDESNLETKLDWIPGMENVRLKDLPGLLTTADPNHSSVQFICELADRVHEASAIVFNTMDELEGDAMNALSSMNLPPLYTIGPFPSFLKQSPNGHGMLHSIGSNLWKEDECLQWLDSKEPRSVVYVNFGSITVMSPEKLLEFAWGLANSKKPFLWIIRPDLVVGGSVILSSEFVNETKDRGLIASWCRQEEVLNHPSVGGFLSHCGWNSTTESVSAGVPMLCWPFFADQPRNCMYVCNEWGIGAEIDKDVKREGVEKLVNELMVGEKGEKMRERVGVLKEKAEEVTAVGGSSYVNLENVIKEALLKQN